MAYIDKYGVEFSDDQKTLLRVPENYKGVYEIPNGTTYVEVGAFNNCKYITTIVVPKTIDDYLFQDEEFNFLAGCQSLSYFIVDSQNEYYYTIDGILCSKGIDGNYVVAYPPAKHDFFYLPNDMKLCRYNSSNECQTWGFALHCTPVILQYLYIDNICNPNYILKDGVLYNKSLDLLIKLSLNETKYIMPDSVITISDNAFGGCSKLKTISLGKSFKDWDCPCEITDVFRDCCSLESIDVHDDNEHYYSIDGVLYERYSCETGYSQILLAPCAKRKKVYEIYEDVAGRAFANCKNIDEFKIDYPVRIGCDAFINTAFYNNSRNWDGDFLYLGKYLIKVSEGYNKSTLVIPPTSHVIVDASITNSNITTIEISEGVFHFNSHSIRCPNLKTIKLPSSLFSSYLSENQIEFKTWCDNNAPKLEKILIPNGMRDFYLPHINSCYHKLLFEYDSMGNEIPIKKLTSDEEIFYNSIHAYSGFPNYKQYATIKRALLNEDAMSEEQMLSLLPNVEKFELRFWSTNIQTYLEKEGYVVRHIWYKSGDENNRISLYYIELDNKIEELKNALAENQELKTIDFRRIFGVGWDNECSKYTRLRNYYFKCVDK